MKRLRALSNPTKNRIINILAEKSLTNTELYEILKKEGLEYRESAFKALKQLVKVGLVKKTFNEKQGSYKYSLNTKEFNTGNHIRITIK